MGKKNKQEMINLQFFKQFNPSFMIAEKDELLIYQNGRSYPFDKKIKCI